MAMYPNNADLLSREYRRDRMQEAEQWRLVKNTTAWSPALGIKLTTILLSRWKKFWSGLYKKERYIPISQAPKSKPVS